MWGGGRTHPEVSLFLANGLALMERSATGSQRHYRLPKSRAQVCRSAYQQVLGLSNNKMQNVIELSVRGASVPPPHGNTGGLGRNPQKYNIAKAFTEHNYDMSCDKINDTTRHRPSDDTHSLLYELEFTPYFTSLFPNRQVPSQSSFESAARHADFKDVTKPAKHSHATCQECGILRTMRKLALRSQEDLTHVNNAIRAHKALHTAEQQSVLVRIIQAKFMAGTFLYLAHDGTVSFGWPRFGRRRLKNMARKTFVEMRVNGLMDFSTNTSVYFYHLKHWNPKSIDVILTEWYMYILAVKQSNHPSSKSRVLILQLDNYVGDNKQVYTFVFGACLLAWGWYDVVLYTYLKEGHTHCIVDAHQYGIQCSR